MKIQAAVFYQPNVPFKIEPLDLEAPKAGEVLVKVAAAGVCHSDWHLMTGATKHALPVVPGHEGAGVVEAVGEGVTNIKPGDHVALNWAPNCGTCFYCLDNRPSLCSTYVEPIWAGTMMDGTTRLSKNGDPVYHFSATACFANYTVVPQECCIPLDNDIPLTIAALIGCAVTTGVGAVLNTANVKPASRIKQAGPRKYRRMAGLAFRVGNGISADDRATYLSLPGGTANAPRYFLPVRTSGDVKSS